MVIIFKFTTEIFLFFFSEASNVLKAPSYFTSFFSDPLNADKKLCIDRSPDIFQRVIEHLQGYHIVINTEYEYCQIFGDAYYFSLPKLKKKLLDTEIFVNVGCETFKVDRKIFSNIGDTPNYFTVSYSTLFQGLSPVLLYKQLIRPPPMASPRVPNRSPILFKEILNLLQGSPLPPYNTKREKEYMDLLLKECRYYRFLNLEQKIIPHYFTNDTNLGIEEITINFKHINLQGISLLLLNDENENENENENDSDNDNDNDNDNDTSLGIIQRHIIMYKRPFVDFKPSILIIQLSTSNSIFTISNNSLNQSSISIGDDLLIKRFEKLSSIIFKKLEVSTSDDRLFIKRKRTIGNLSSSSLIFSNLNLENSDIILNNIPTTSKFLISNQNLKKRKYKNDNDDVFENNYTSFDTNDKSFRIINGLFKLLYRKIYMIHIV